MIWEDFSGIMVSVENEIPISPTVVLVQDKILW